MRIDEHDLQIGLHEGEVVVASVPENDVGFRFGLPEDPFIVHPCEHDITLPEMGLVFFPLLDGAVRLPKVLQRSKPLDRLLRQVAVWHGMTDHGDPHAGLSKPPRRRARERTFPRPRPHGADGDHRFGGAQHRRVWSQQIEVRPGRERPRGQVHDLLVRDVAVGEDDVIDRMGVDDRFQLSFRDDGNAVRIQGPRYLRGVPPSGDIGNLGGGKGDHAAARVIAIDHVEIMEIAAGRTHDHDVPGRIGAIFHHTSFHADDFRHRRRVLLTEGAVRTSWIHQSIFDFDGTGSWSLPCRTRA